MSKYVIFKVFSSSDERSIRVDNESIEIQQPYLYGYLFRMVRGGANVKCKNMYNQLQL